MMSWVPLQSNAPVIEAWQVVGAYGIPMTWLNPARILQTQTK